MKKPSSPKERNLLKACIRRVFSRSELRQHAMLTTRIEHFDPERPRVTKWSFCLECGTIEPTYKMEADHAEPLIPVNSSLEDMTWDEVVDRAWCELENLRPVCKPCHKLKTRLEGQERRRLKKERA